MARVSPMRSSNWRTGSSPASPDSWPGDDSMASGVPKKSRTWGQAEGIVVVLVLVASQDAVDAGTDHLQERVLGQVRVAGIIEDIGKSLGEPDALVELADGEQPGVAGELPW